MAAERGAKWACASGGTVQGAAFGGAKMQNSEIWPFWLVLVDEIQDCRILVSRRVGVDVTPLGIFKFIMSFGGNDVFPNLKVGLQILLTMSISLSGCERSFSKMKLIMTYLRSTMTEGRLTNLAILSIERETVEQVDFTKLIENFAAVTARKVLI